MNSKKNAKDRVSIDVGGIREDVEKAYKTIAWGETPFATKIRILVMEKLAELAKTAKSDSDEN